MRTKIKRIKRMRTEIEKQKTKNKEDKSCIISCRREKKNDHQQQFNHHISSCTTLGGRGYNGTSIDMVEC